MSTADILTQAIADARAGRRAEAKAMLLKVLEADDRNEPAWLWLSGVIETSDERRVCLENVLAINPDNPHARRGLDLLNKQRPPASTPAPRPDAAPLTPDVQTAPPAGVTAPQVAPASTPASSPPPSPHNAGLWLPNANGQPPVGAATIALAPPPAATQEAGPVTGKTLQLDAPLTPTQGKQPWWRRGKSGAASSPPPAPTVTDGGAPGVLASPGTAAGGPGVAPHAPQASPTGLAAPTPAITLPQVVDESLDSEEPCPYCGTMTRLTHNRCPACHKSLLVRGEVSAKASVWLTILVILYAIGSVGAVLGGGLLIFGLVMANIGAATMGLDLPILPLVGAIVAILVGVGLCIAITLGLWKRKAWAYVTHCVSLVLSILVTVASSLLMALIGAAVMSAFAEMPQAESGDAAGALGMAAASAGSSMVCNIIILVAYTALTVMSYHDFFGRKARMSTAGLPSGDEPYNAGIKYRDREMWYMAAHEWERAAHAEPQNATVRRALGLAYAQLKRFDQARTTLQAALSLAPGNPQLVEDLALVERLAAKKR